MITMAEEWQFAPDFAEQIRQWIGEHLEPEDVFSEERLSEWAVDHGYALIDWFGDEEEEVK